MSRVLVTGATGFVGSEIALEFLRQGFKVRQAIRNQAQADAWNEKFPQYKSDVDFVFIESLETLGTFDEAVKDVTYIAHSASPATFSPEDNRRDILDPAISGTVEILRSATKSSTVKAVVITSSVTAYLDYLHLPKADYIVTDKDWNPFTYEQAAALPKTQGRLVYAASKKLAERAAWDFMEKEKPSFTLTTVAPTWILGHNNEPSLKSRKNARSTYAITANTLIDAKAFPDVPTTAYVNVLDVAKAHVGAVTTPSAAGKRYLLVGGRYNPEEAARLAAKAVPEQAHRFPHTNGREFEPTFYFDASPAERDFGFKYISLEDTIGAWAKQIFSLPEQ